MFFKFSAKNAFRDLVKNARRITISTLSREEKLQNYKDLFENLKPRLRENEVCLNQSPAFHASCLHWNQRSVQSIRPVRNLRNPWLLFKREFEEAMTDERNCDKKVGVALAWFYAIPEGTRNAWVV